MSKLTSIFVKRMGDFRRSSRFIASQLRNQSGGSFEKFAHDSTSIKTDEDPQVTNRASLRKHFDREPAARQGAE
jgi:hypothetical protein